MARLCEIALFTDDVEAVLTFYRRILGSGPLWQSDDGGQLVSDGVALLVHRTLSAAPGMPPNESHVAFSVPDLEATVAALEADGLHVIAGPETYDWGRSAYLRDPDGRLVEIAQE